MRSRCLSPLVVVAAFGLFGCSGQTGMFPAAQDARLIVKSVTPVVDNMSFEGVPPGTVEGIKRNLAQARSEAAALDHEYTPNLLDVQEFYSAAQPALAALSGIPGLPPQSIGIVDAATALLPTFPAVDGSPPPPGPFKMSVAQARLLLGAPSTSAASAVAPVRPEPVVAVVPPPPPRLATAPRFHVAIDDLGDGFSYEFSDGGQVLDKGQVATLRLIEARFEAFKKRRLAQAQ